jgi:D-tyrosyl-tRNA(Tyr) deacylase
MQAIYAAGPMRAVVQRVKRAEVRVEGVVTGSIGPGLAILLGVGRGDSEAEADRLAARLARLRVFPDADGRFDASLLDSGGAALVISQFTLYGDSSRGNRPSFSAAAAPELAEPLYERVCERLAAEGVHSVERGRFGAHMEVELVNDGPVTIVLELASA